MSLIRREYRHHGPYTIKVSVIRRWPTKGQRKVVTEVRNKLPWPFRSLFPGWGRRRSKVATHVPEDIVDEAMEEAVEAAKAYIEQNLLR